MAKQPGMHRRKRGSRGQVPQQEEAAGPVGEVQWLPQLDGTSEKDCAIDWVGCDKLLESLGSKHF
jgi:hypothetical protein